MSSRAAGLRPGQESRDRRVLTQLKALAFHAHSATLRPSILSKKLPTFLGGASFDRLGDPRPMQDGNSPLHFGQRLSSSWRAMPQCFHVWLSIWLRMLASTCHVGVGAAAIPLFPSPPSPPTEWRSIRIFISDTVDGARGECGNSFNTNRICPRSSTKPYLPVADHECSL